VSVIQRVELDEATLLGAPLLCGAALDTAWDAWCEDLARAVDRLKTISSQDALTLFRSSFSAPRVLHLLRCSPSVDHPSLNKFDSKALMSEANIVYVFFSELGQKIASVSGDNQEPAFFLALFSHYSARQLHLVTQQLSQRRVATPVFKLLLLTLGISTTESKNNNNNKWARVRKLGL